MSARRATFDFARLVFYIVTVGPFLGAAQVQARPVASDTTDKTTNRVLIIPGVGIPTLQLEESHDTVTQHFPFKKGVDQKSTSLECGTELNWVDIEDPKGGNIFIHLRDDIVFQVDFAGSRYRTTEYLNSNSTPEDVKKRYKGLRAYVLSDNTSEAFGNRSLIYWIDHEKGIAFAFAYSKTEHERYLYEIIVFRPHAEICPMDDDSTHSPAKRELTPYSLEPGKSD